MDHNVQPGARRARRVAALAGALLTSALWQMPAQAQTLADDYWINLQAYYPKVDTKVRATANTQSAIGTDIDMERDLALDRNEVVPAVSLGSRLGKVIVGADFFRLERSGEIGIARDIVFDGTTYPASASIGSSFESDVYRFTVGYAFVQKPDLEIGAALGLHATDFRISLSGEAAIGNDAVQATTRVKKVFAPLPTVGLFGTWQVAPRLEANGRVDYLSLKIKDYDGKLVNVQAGLNYRVLDNLALGVAYRYVDYRLGIDKDAWSGRVRYKMNGPALVLQASF
ncbi:MAG: hypothetical protein VYD90_08545 [Pseudomonadota bacterium]|nr:hypothetical protein [Pseudomonadota bacterium]